MSFEIDKKNIIDLYNSSLDEYGYTPRGITWGSKKSQCDRFSVMLGLGDFNKKSVLDVGCGLGDFWDYLLQQGICVKKYLGIDINEKLISVARARYPKGNFLVLDMLSEEVEDFDFLVASGTFGINVPNWEELTYKMLIKMFSISRIGMSVNFLSTYSVTRSGSHYVDPSEMLYFVCAQLSKKIILRQDYKDNDFNIYVYK
jgi:SAM-dependent methyltransferase